MRPQLRECHSYSLTAFIQLHTCCGLFTIICSVDIAQVYDVKKMKLIAFQHFTKPGESCQTFFENGWLTRLVSYSSLIETFLVDMFYFTEIFTH